MNILILGSGGREHALAWAILQNPKCDRLICAPGNGGLAEIAECADLDILDSNAIIAFCAVQTVDFVVIGPEAPLVEGIADALRAAGIMCFGPSAAAAQLEASKSFTKKICAAAKADTAAYAVFARADDAHAYIDGQSAPIVIKADGLAAGKGVVVATDLTEAHLAVDDMLGGQFGAAGSCVVVEQFLTGKEASLFVLCHGETALAIGTAQDHKRAFDGDNGPNTGGMGAYAPAPVLTPAIEDQVMDGIIRPTLSTMAARGTPFQGVLYAGLMIDAGHARLVEYNVRFGDPECQVLCMRLGAQMLDLLLACAENRLDTIKVNWADDHALTVVMAANGYPGSYSKGSVIKGLDAIAATSKQCVFHAGTSVSDHQTVASGGRVLSITARADTLQGARDRAYALIAAIEWPDGFYRQDIGWRALGH